MSQAWTRSSSPSVVARSTTSPSGLTITEPATFRSLDELRSQYYIAMQVTDRPGVLAQVAAEFGEHGVSIQTMEQKGTGDAADLWFITHEASHAALRSTLDALAHLDAVNAVDSVIRLIADA